VGSDSNESESAADHRLIRDDFHNKNPLVRVFAVGKFKRYLKDYYENKEPLTTIDHRLLKGFYSGKRSELDRDHKRALLTP
jgi:hypothetical protein